MDFLHSPNEDLNSEHWSVQHFGGGESEGRGEGPTASGGCLPIVSGGHPNIFSLSIYGAHSSSCRAPMTLKEYS